LAKSRSNVRRENVLTSDALMPAVDFLKFDAQGAPFLEGRQCAQCNEVFTSPRRACPSCFSLEKMAPVTLKTTGRLHCFTIVHRSFPGVVTPFVSAIVDVDGGGVLKGNLVDIAPDPQAIAAGMPVTVVFREAATRGKNGEQFVIYAFAPSEIAP
jgi:uncharacterized protein